MTDINMDETARLYHGVYIEEIERLQAENERLRAEMERLRHLRRTTGTDFFARAAPKERE